MTEPQARKLTCTEAREKPLVRRAKRFCLIRSGSSGVQIAHADLRRQPTYYIATFRPAIGNGCVMKEAAN